MRTRQVISLTDTVENMLQTCLFFLLKNAVKSSRELLSEVDSRHTAESSSLQWTAAWSKTFVPWREGRWEHQVLTTKPWGPVARIWDPVLFCLEKKKILTRRWKVERKVRCPCGQTHGWVGETFMSLGKLESFISWQSFRSLLSSGQLFCFDPMADLFQDHSYVCAHPSAKMDSVQGPFGELGHFIMA